MLTDSIKRFFYTLSLNELHMMNRKILNPDITYNTLLYLDIIELTPECTVSRIAQQLHISKPAVTAKINELISQGLVKKTQSSQDKRIFYLNVINDAAQAYNAYNKNLTRAVEHAQKEFSDEDISAFCRVLEGISQKYMEGCSNE